MKKRDLIIQKNFTREINLSTKMIRDRTKYSKKIKHKNSIESH